MFLIYLHKQKLEFRENSYSDKKRRIGTLIEDGPARWCFYAERSAGGLTADQLFSIVTEMIRLNVRPSPPESQSEAPESQTCHITPEPQSEAL